MINEPGTIKGGWESLSEAIFTANSSNVQISEMKKAFYAGAATAINVMIEISAHEVCEDEGAEIFESLRQEILTFKEQLKNGKI